MKKTLLAIALASSVGTVSAASMTSATFTMLDGTGGGVGVDTSVTGSIGGGTWSVASTTAFFGQNWTAHSGTTFGPGTYSFATVQGGTYTNVVVGAGQVGGHILFNWGVVADIDVINVWDVTTTTVLNDTYTSTDVIGGSTTNGAGSCTDGIRGCGMIDGAFAGFNANFDFVAPVPVPAAVWLFGSGLLGLVGVARRKAVA